MMVYKQGIVSLFGRKTFGEAEKKAMRAYAQTNMVVRAMSIESFE